MRGVGPLMLLADWAAGASSRSFVRISGLLIAILDGPGLRYRGSRARGRNSGGFHWARALSDNRLIYPISDRLGNHEPCRVCASRGPLPRALPALASAGKASCEGRPKAREAKSADARAALPARTDGRG